MTYHLPGADCCTYFHAGQTIIKMKLNPHKTYQNLDFISSGLLMKLGTWGFHIEGMMGFDAKWTFLEHCILLGVLGLKSHFQILAHSLPSHPSTPTPISTNLPASPSVLALKRSEFSMSFAGPSRNKFILGEWTLDPLNQIENCQGSMMMLPGLSVNIRIKGYTLNQKI